MKFFHTKIAFLKRLQVFNKIKPLGKTVQHTSDSLTRPGMTTRVRDVLKSKDPKFRGKNIQEYRRGSGTLADTRAYETAKRMSPSKFERDIGQAARQR